LCFAEDNLRVEESREPESQTVEGPKGLANPGSALAALLSIFRIVFWIADGLAVRPDSKSLILFLVRNQNQMRLWPLSAAIAGATRKHDVKDECVSISLELVRIVFRFH
jgi:hypothetical protein